ncbi:MAG: YceI family protein [Desulfuromonadales bacterium]|nr:YceI family protein [Desulfuromonadales bacterium]
MKHKILASMVVFLLLAATASALTLEGSCDIRFFGRSTLHGFDGTAACQPFTLATSGEIGDSGMIQQTVVEVLVEEMDTGNTIRDKQMHAMFEQKSYPKIQGLFTDLDPDVVMRQLQAKDNALSHLEFDLRIRDINQWVQAVTRDLVVNPEQISFTMAFPVSLASFQLQPPSVLGFIKVDDQIQVEVSVVLWRH